MNICWKKYSFDEETGKKVLQISELYMDGKITKDELWEKTRSIICPIIKKQDLNEEEKIRRFSW